MPAKKSSSKSRQLPITVETIERRIFLVRGQKVMLDTDLAELYGVPTRRLNEQVRRNLKRFPADFMFQLTGEEAGGLRSQIAISNTEVEASQSLRSQNVTSNAKRGGRRYAPYVFTEQGVAMLSSVLNSERAIEVNIAIMRAFVQLREMLSTHKDLAQKLEQMEKKYDKQFRVVFDAIRELMQPAAPTRRKIGF